LYGLHDLYEGVLRVLYNVLFDQDKDHVKHSVKIRMIRNKYYENEYQKGI